MFDNIGRKIKGLAKIFAWTGIIGSAVVGVCSAAATGIAGLLVAVIGALLSWAGSFVLYGFGQLVENSDQLVALSKRAVGSWSQDI